MYIIILLFQLVSFVMEIQQAVDRGIGFFIVDVSPGFEYIQGGEWRKPDSACDLLYNGKDSLILSLGTESFLHKGDIFYVNSEFFCGLMKRNSKLYSRKWKLTFREASRFYYLADRVYFFSGSGILHNEKNAVFINAREEYRFTASP